MYIGTLRSYVRAMGGELEIVAHFPEGDARISLIADLDDDAPDAREALIKDLEGDVQIARAQDADGGLPSTGT